MEGARAAALLAALLAAPTTGSYPTCSCPSNPLGHDLCQPLAPGGESLGSQVVAVDHVQAGVGDLVLVLTEGNDVRQILGADAGPIRSLVVGIVDAVEIP